MNANADIFPGPELVAALADDTAAPISAEISCESKDWNPEDFAREQIRSLVRQVFFATGASQVKQVVFSAAGANRDVAGVCTRVGEALALETSADIAILDRKLDGTPATPAHPYLGSGPIKSWSTQIATNLWLVPEFEVRECGVGARTSRYWLSSLTDLRNEFEYALIQGPPAGMSSEAALLGKLSDGIILIIGANNTRRATARKIKDTLEAGHSRILGTVLSQRAFPIPERIYRRL